MNIELPADLSTSNIYHLAAMHDYFRRNQMLISCKKVEKEVSKRTIKEQHTIATLNYYKPIKDSQRSLL